MSALKKKPPAMSTLGGSGSHFSRVDRVRIEDRPDRAAAIVAVADAGHRRVDAIVRLVVDVLGVEIAALGIGIDRIVVVGGELPARLVVETLAQHVHQDDILPVLHAQTRGAGAVEDRTARHPLQIRDSHTGCRWCRAWSRPMPNSPVWL